MPKKKLAETPVLIITDPTVNSDPNVNHLCDGDRIRQTAPVSDDNATLATIATWLNVVESNNAGK